MYYGRGFSGRSVVHPARDYASLERGLGGDGQRNQENGSRAAPGHDASGGHGTDGEVQYVFRFDLLYAHIVRTYIHSE